MMFGLLLIWSSGYVLEGLELQGPQDFRVRTGTLPQKQQLMLGQVIRCHAFYRFVELLVCQGVYGGG